MPAAGPQIELAVVMRAHGLRGELLLKPFNPHSAMLSELSEVSLRLADGSERRFSVREARAHGSNLRVSLQGVDSREQAEALRGAMLWVPRSALPALAPGEYYLVDVVGLEARQDGVAIGRVRDAIEYPTVCCLVIESEGVSREVPDLPRYISEVNVPQGFVTVQHLDEIEPLVPAAQPKARR
jgi:16S rRNA processing protein RimM